MFAFSEAEHLDGLRYEYGIRTLSAIPRTTDAVQSDKKCVVELLRRDHARLEALVARFDSISQRGIGEYLRDLHTAFQCHERAEELVVFPAIRRCHPDGHTIADAYLNESSNADLVLLDAVRAGEHTLAVRYHLEEFCQMVLAHQKHEENDPIELLEGHLKRAERHALGVQFELAKRSAANEAMHSGVHADPLAS